LADVVAKGSHRRLHRFFRFEKHFQDRNDHGKRKQAENGGEQVVDDVQKDLGLIRRYQTEKQLDEIFHWARCYNSANVRNSSLYFFVYLRLKPALT